MNFVKNGIPQGTAPHEKVLSFAPSHGIKVKRVLCGNIRIEQSAKPLAKTHGIHNFSVIKPKGKGQWNIPEYKVILLSREKEAAAVKTKLNFRFHDPNPLGVAAEYIMKELIEANKPKAEQAIREARERKAKRDSAPAVSD